MCLYVIIYLYVYFEGIFGHFVSKGKLVILL